MLRNLSSIPVGEDDLALMDEVDADIDELDELGLPELELSEGELDLEDSLGRVRARRRRRRKSRMSRRARAASRRAKSMPRSAKGRFVKRSRRRSRRRKGVGQEMLFGLGRRQGRRRKSRKGRKARKARGRRKSRSMAGIGLSSLGLDGLMDGMDDGLGAVSSLGRRARRRRRKGAKSRRRRGGRRSRRGRRSMRGLANFDNVAEMGANLADAEVTASMPVVGVFQWLATRPGLEAFGGVALGGIVDGLVRGGLFGKLIKADMSNPVWRISGGLVSAITMWELGRLIGSGNIAKFGAFYALGKLVEGEITNPFIMKQLDLGQDVLLPGIKRPDYAVNPLSGFGTVRVPDTQSIGDYELGQARVFENQNLVGLGTVRVPDTQTIGTVRVPDTQTIGQEMIPTEEMEGAEVGQYGDELSEESEVF